MKGKIMNKQTIESIRKDLRVIADASERVASAARNSLTEELRKIGPASQKCSKAGIERVRRLLGGLDKSMSNLSNRIGDTESQIASELKTQQPKKRGVRVK
jgi:hypothetical protein